MSLNINILPNILHLYFTLIATSSWYLVLVIFFTVCYFFFVLQGANKILFYHPELEDENKKILNVGHIEAVICFARYASKFDYHTYYHLLCKQMY